MKIGVIGLGLIGGSIVKSLSALGYDLTAVTRNEKTIESAKAFCNCVSDKFSALIDCNVVFVAVPMFKVLETLDRLETIVKPETIVADVSSLKQFVMQKNYQYKFIGSHPMAGTEHSGFEHSFKEMFEGAKWVLTPHENCENEVSVLSELICKMGAEPVITEAEPHDKAVAKISHMPMLVAQALFESVKDDKLAMKLASSGFRDMTRLAMSNVDMADDMLTLNGGNIDMAFADLEDAVEALYVDYKSKITNIRELRSAMYDQNGRNIYKG